MKTSTSTINRLRRDLSGEPNHWLSGSRRNYHQSAMRIPLAKEALCASVSTRMLVNIEQVHYLAGNDRCIGQGHQGRWPHFDTGCWGIHLSQSHNICQRIQLRSNSHCWNKSRRSYTVPPLGTVDLNYFHLCHASCSLRQCIQCDRRVVLRYKCSDPHKNQCPDTAQRSWMTLQVFLCLH